VLVKSVQSLPLNISCRPALCIGTQCLTGEFEMKTRVAAVIALSHTPASALPPANDFCSALGYEALIDTLAVDGQLSVIRCADEP